MDGGGDIVRLPLFGASVRENAVMNQGFIPGIVLLKKRVRRRKKQSKMEYINEKHGSQSQATC